MSGSHGMFFYAVGTFRNKPTALRNVPWLHLPGHEVRTVPEMGWASFKNGAFLAAASGKFDVLVTTDQRLSYQHNVSTFAIAIVVLVARRNKLEFLLPLAPELRKVLQGIKLGEVRRVGV